MLSVFDSEIFDGARPRSGAAYFFRLFLERPQRSKSARLAVGLFVPQSGQGIGVELIVQQYSMSQSRKTRPHSGHLKYVLPLTIALSFRRVVARACYALGIVHAVLDKLAAGSGQCRSGE